MFDNSTKCDTDIKWMIGVMLCQIPSMGSVKAANNDMDIRCQTA